VLPADSKLADNARATNQHRYDAESARSSAALPDRDSFHMGLASSGFRSPYIFFFSFRVAAFPFELEGRQRFRSRRAFGLRAMQEQGEAGTALVGVAVIMIELQP
jgi:hypothetical protein